MRTPALLTVATSLSAIFIGVAAAQGTAPQVSANTPQSTFKATARIVNVNVVVTDAHGNPITGLTKDDFELLDNGHEQTIRFFERIANVTPPPLAQLPPDTYSNQQPTSATPPSVTAILFDIQNTGWVAQAYALQHLRTWLRKLHPEDRVALYLQDGHIRMLHDFTQDSSDLIAAIHRYDAQHSGPKEQRLTLKRNEISDLDRFLAGGENKLNYALWERSTRRAGSPLGGTALNSFGGLTPDVLSTGYRGPDTAASTVTTLAAIARHLAPARGRKSLIWISEKVPTIFPDQEGLQRDLLRRVVWSYRSAPPKYHGLKAALLGPNGLTDGEGPAMRDICNGFYSGDLVPLLVRLFNDNNIAVYPVSAEGLQTLDLGFRNPDLASVPSSALAPMLINSLEAPDGPTNIYAHMEMEGLAQRTGGRAYYNRNDLESGIQHALDDARYTYELAYYPDHNDWRGEWRKIQVKLKNPERFVAPPDGALQQVKNFLVGGFSVHVLARGGYFALPEPKPEATEDRRALVSRTINNPDQVPQLPFTVHIVPLPDSKNPQLQALITIDAHNLLTPNGDGRWGGNFELFFAQLGQNQFATPVDEKRRCCTLRRPLEVPTRTLDFTLSAEEYKEAIEKGISTAKTLQLQPGANVLSIVLHDKASNAVGSIRIPLEQYAAKMAPAASPH